MQRYMKGLSNGGMVQSVNEPLATEQLRRAVPSIFAVEAHESRSDRFTPIPTATVIEGLRREGFDPFFAQQARTRIEGKAEYTKHMVRLRHRSLTRADGDSFEIILINANDGTSAYQMLPGFFRFVCANGLFTGDTFDEVKVRHSGNAVDDVIEGACRVLDEAPRVTEQVSAWKGLTLDDREQKALAEAAHEIRFPQAHTEDEDKRRDAPVEPARLLMPRRHADANDGSLWSTYNRIQENAVKGGQAGYVQGKGGRRRRQSTRAVKSVDQSRTLNRALWTLAERMAELKAA